jgi:hypothetical protein
VGEMIRVQRLPQDRFGAKNFKRVFNTTNRQPVHFQRVTNLKTA